MDKKEIIKEALICNADNYLKSGEEYFILEFSEKTLDQTIEDILQSLEQPEEKTHHTFHRKPCTNFESDDKTSSATICKHCGHEKYNHVWDKKIYPNGF